MKRSLLLALMLIREVVSNRHNFPKWQENTKIECECVRCRVRKRFALDDDAKNFVNDHGEHGQLTITVIDLAGRGLVQWGTF